MNYARGAPNGRMCHVRRNCELLRVAVIVVLRNDCCDTVVGLSENPQNLPTGSTIDQIERIEHKCHRWQQWKRWNSGFELVCRRLQPSNLAIL